MYVNLFRTQSGEHRERDGQACKIIRELGDNERDMEEVGVMYEIEFEDHGRIHAFADEVLPE